MRASCAAALLAVTLLALAPAAHANTPQACISLWAGYTKAGQTQGIAQQDFMAACLAHKVTAAPPQLTLQQAAPPGATGRCRDGLYTTAAVPLAGCDHHGGLAGLVRP